MESSIESQSHKIPALLWDSLQSVCFTHDQQFLRDVARITGLNERDLKVKLLGRCGMPTAIVVEKGPWWLGSTCAAMVRGNGGLWARCGAYCCADGFCHGHTLSGKRGFGKGNRILRFDDPYFASLQKRRPVELEGELLWVGEDGSIVTAAGLLRTDLRIDLNTGTATEGKHGESDRDDLERASETGEALLFAHRNDKGPSKEETEGADEESGPFESSDD